MFDEVTRRRTGETAARKAGFLLGSTALQVLVVAAILAASAAMHTQVVEEPQIEVKFVRAATPPTTPPSPPTRPMPPAPPPRKAPPPATAGEALPRPPPAQALIQPKDPAPELTVDPDEPREPQSDEPGAGEGVVGGVVGAPPASAAPGSASPGFEDAPVYARAGFRRPAVADRGCVERNLRLREELLDRVPGGALSVKFAVRPDGTLGHFQVLQRGIPEQISGAIWSAIQRCRWIPGEDAEGRPTSIYVIMPLRFTID